MNRLIWKLYNENMISMEVAHILLDKHYNRVNKKRHQTMEKTSKWITNLKHKHKDLLIINQIQFQTLYPSKKQSVTTDDYNNIVVG